jgi:hypothetical protein
MTSPSERKALLDDRTPLVVASHMRSGTHLTIDLLRRNLASASSRYLNLDRLMPGEGHGAPLRLADFERELSGLGACPLLKTHTPAATGWFRAADERSLRANALLASSRILYVVRDGRDVLVSLYYYMRHYSEHVREQSFERFLRDRDDFFQACPGFEGLDRVSAWARHVEGWLAEPRVVVIRYEDLISRREKCLRRALERLELPAPERVEPVPVPAGLPRRLLRRLIAPIFPRRVSTAIRPRRGVSGDAAGHFTQRDEMLFRERAGAVLERLGALGLAS